jgi:hypothetical protein
MPAQQFVDPNRWTASGFLPLLLFPSLHSARIFANSRTMRIGVEQGNVFAEDLLGGQ